MTEVAKKNFKYIYKVELLIKLYLKLEITCNSVSYSSSFPTDCCQSPTVYLLRKG